MARIGEEGISVESVNRDRSAPMNEVEDDGEMKKQDQIVPVMPES